MQLYDNHVLEWGDLSRLFTTKHVYLQRMGSDKPSNLSLPISSQYIQILAEMFCSSWSFLFWIGLCNKVHRSHSNVDVDAEAGVFKSGFGKKI